MKNIKTQKLSKETQKLFVELVNIELSSYSKTTLNMIGNTIKFYGSLIPFNNVSINYLATLYNNTNKK